MKRDWTLETEITGYDWWLMTYIARGEKLLRNVALSLEAIVGPAK